MQITGNVLPVGCIDRTETLYVIDPKARTYDEITANWAFHYGIKLTEVGPGFDVVILGHHQDARRVLAAVNRYARWFWAQDSLAEIANPSSDGSAPGTFSQRWAKFATEDEDAPLIEPWGKWRIDWNVDPFDPNAFPITLWLSGHRPSVRAEAIWMDEPEPEPASRALRISLPTPMPWTATAPVSQADVDALIESMQVGRYFMADLHKGYSDAVRAAGRVPASRIALGRALGRDPRVARFHTAKGAMWHLA